MSGKSIMKNQNECLTYSGILRNDIPYFHSTIMEST